MKALKTACSWLALITLGCACWAYGRNLIDGGSVTGSFGDLAVIGAVAASAACSLFQPPAWPKGAK